MPGQERMDGKTCVICGKDTAGLPRVKDTQGRYYHKECREAAKRRLAARGAVAPSSSAPRATLSAARSVSAPPRSPTAAPVSPPRPVAKAAPKPPPAEDGLHLLDELSSLESATPSVEAGIASMCPGCGQMLPSGAVICVACGFNIKTGARLAAPAVAVPKAKLAKKKGTGDGGLSNNPWLYGGIPTLVILILFLVGRGNETAYRAFLLTYSAINLGVLGWCIVRGFVHSIVWGVLCLIICVPIIHLIFIFGVNRDARLKAACSAAIVGGICYHLLGGDAFLLNSAGLGVPGG